MKQTDYLITGGSAAGTTAADVIRMMKPDAKITIVTDEPYEFYSRVLLPPYVRHKVSREQVFLKSGDWYAQRKIDFVKGVRAEKLDSGKKEVSFNNGEIYHYGRLLITVGGKTIQFDAPGANLNNILYFRTIDDADKIIEACKGAKSAVVIGGGFIGLEFASCFKANGVEDVTALVIEPYFWLGKLDEDSSRVLAGTLTKNGVKIITEEEVVGFEGAGKVEAVVTKSGKRYEAQVVGIGIGIRADIEWLKDSGIKVARGVLTNEYLETSIADVYAAGDCAEFKDVIFERQHMLGNWANATNQGSAVGKTMAGVRTVFETASSYTTNYFDGSCSFIGVTDEDFVDEIISRGSVESGKMTRIYIKTISNVLRIVGATVINNAGEVAPISTAIKNKIDVDSFRSRLSDVNFELKDLITPSNLH